MSTFSTPAEQNQPEAVSDSVVVEGSTTLPTKHGVFLCHAFRVKGSDTVHLAMVLGDLAERESVLTRLHSECLTGDVFGSCRCDCGEQLEASLSRIAARGCGVVLYLRDHEGRGIGLANKIRAYALQEQGRDTVEANLELGLPVDARDYGAAAAMLRWLSVRSISLMTNNPRKLQALSSVGIVIAQHLSLRAPSRPENEHYLRTKVAKLGHFPAAYRHSHAATHDTLSTSSS